MAELSFSNDSWLPGSGEEFTFMGRGGLLHASPIVGALSHLILTTILQIATFVEEEVEA